ncbi:hypothetical protein F4802DRAFT_595380 [Xylaria palmicola]|nr:hypothetical protein F4802DRAFT_595380 [Xylaria palmicola]
MSSADRYLHLYKHPKGGGDARPTALQVVSDEGRLGDMRSKTILVTGGSQGIGLEASGGGGLDDLGSVRAEAEFFLRRRPALNILINNAGLLCHCVPCRKCAGANGSTNLVVDPEHFHQTGEVRNWARKGISGLNVVYDFCATCPTIVVVRPEAMGGKLIVKTGLLDSAEDIARLAPRVELFVKDRIDTWCERSDDVILKEVR